MNLRRGNIDSYCRSMGKIHGFKFFLLTHLSDIAVTYVTEGPYLKDHWAIIGATSEDLRPLAVDKWLSEGNAVCIICFIIHYPMPLVAFTMGCE